ncbi:MAG: 4-demethylwyosine synthase TYW1 [Candidatus Aenigmarchaeota archaeon]|nr:4-demethylwyosine synthase TYW1 [Candidatus Aenigmarchaeota archaeon]
MPLKMPKETEKSLRNKQYGVFNHSAVQICTWTKKSLRDENFCYKQQFYGVDCHRCMEFTPSSVFCEQNCIFCWRPMELMRSKPMNSKEVDEPKEIYENLLKARYKLINGFPGNKKVNIRKYRESLIPSHFAISLSGEPTMYPKLPELIRFLKSLNQTKSVFLVTNAQEPGMLERLIKEDALPTQIYVSVNAPNEELFKKISCPTRKTGWKTFLRSLGIVSNMKTRRIMRMTMIKGMNMDSKYIGEYGKLIRKMNPHFIEVKAYMFIGYSRKRLKIENMPFHKDVKELAEKLSKETGFGIIDEKEDSRIVLLQNPKDKIDQLILNP